VPQRAGHGEGAYGDADGWPRGRRWQAADSDKIGRREWAQPKHKDKATLWAIGIGLERSESDEFSHRWKQPTLEPREEKRDGDRHGCFIAEDDVSNFARAIMSSSTWMYTRPST
jgi:hypothetical protein